MVNKIFKSKQNAKSLFTALSNQYISKLSHLETQQNLLSKQNNILNMKQDTINDQKTTLNRQNSNLFTKRRVIVYDENDDRSYRKYIEFLKILMLIFASVIIYFLYKLQQK